MEQTLWNKLPRWYPPLNTTILNFLSQGSTAIYPPYNPHLVPLTFISHASFIILFQVVGIRLSRELTEAPCLFQSFVGETGVTIPGRRPRQWHIEAVRWLDYMSHPFRPYQQDPKEYKVLDFWPTGFDGKSSVLTVNHVRNSTRFSVSIYLCNLFRR